MVSDEGLIRRSQAGDAEAFGQLVERYAAEVRLWAARQIRTAEDADDVTQEVLLKAFRQLHQLREPSRLKGWLRSITHNVAVSWHRRRAVQLQLMEVLLKEAPDAVEPTASEDDVTLHLSIRRALAALSHRQRQVVVHHYLKGYTYGETAELLGLDVTAVRSRLQKARTRLRKELTSMGKGNVGNQSYELDTDDLDVLRWASRFVSDDPKRAVLCTICLDSGGKVVGCDWGQAAQTSGPRPGRPGGTRPAGPSHPPRST